MFSPVDYEEQNKIRNSGQFNPVLLKHQSRSECFGFDTHEVAVEVLVGATKSETRFPVGTGKLACCLFNVQRSFCVPTEKAKHG